MFYYCITILDTAVLGSVLGNDLRTNKGKLEHN